jgi:hypothetical protein
VTAVTGVLFDNASFFGQRTLAVDERLNTPPILPDSYRRMSGTPPRISAVISEVAYFAPPAKLLAKAAMAASRVAS